MKKYISGIFVIMVLINLSSCIEDDTVSQIHTFTTATWERFEHLNFEFEIDDPEEAYDISVIIKHTSQYPNEKLYVNIVMITPGGEERIKDYNLFIKDRDGKFIGYETDGIYNRVIKIREGMRFYEAGSLKFDIENLMPIYYTPGIIEFGILIEEAEG